MQGEGTSRIIEQGGHLIPQQNLEKIHHQGGTKNPSMEIPSMDTILPLMNMVTKP